jgi:hypothetical protein
LCARLHNRMPAILAPEAWPAWLGEEPADLARLKALLGLPWRKTGRKDRQSPLLTSPQAASAGTVATTTARALMRAHTTTTPAAETGRSRRRYEPRGSR